MTASMWSESEHSSGDARAARLHGATRAAVGACVVGLFGWLGWHLPAAILAGLVVFVLVSALFSPLGVYGRIRALVDWTTWLVGVVVGSVLLTGVYLAVVWPLGLVVRRRDRLGLRESGDRESYWVRCSPPESRSRRSLS